MSAASGSSTCEATYAPRVDASGADWNAAGSPPCWTAARVATIAYSATTMTIARTNVIRTATHAAMAPARMAAAKTSAAASAGATPVNVGPLVEPLNVPAANAPAKARNANVAATHGRVQNTANARSATAAPTAAA